MFRSQKLRKLVLCVGLVMTAVMGAPIPPDEIEDFLRIEQQATITMSARKESEDTDDEDIGTSDGSVPHGGFCSCRTANCGRCRDEY